MLWDEEAIKRRWSKSSRNKKKKKKLSLHDQQLPPRTRTRRRSATGASVKSSPTRASVKSSPLQKKSRRQAQCSTPAHLLKQKKNNTTTTTPPTTTTTTTNNNQQQPTTNSTFCSESNRKEALPPCSVLPANKSRDEAGGKSATQRTGHHRRPALKASVKCLSKGVRS